MRYGEPERGGEGGGAYVVAAFRRESLSSRFTGLAMP